MFVVSPIVCNVKISFIVKTHSLIRRMEMLKYVTKKTQTYYIIKNIYTYTIYRNAFEYKKSFIVNITGIKDFSEILRAVRHFQSFAPVECECVKIDNSTAFGRYLGSIDFALIKLCLDNSQEFKYNCHLFPGCFVRLRNRKNIIIFKSGKYNIIGCKSREEIKLCFKEIVNIFKKYNDLLTSRV